MTPRSLCVCAILATSALGGCIVFPHRTNLSPTILGELPANPGARVRVAVSESGSCNGSTRDTTANQDGRFVLAPLREWNALVVVMAHKYFHWQLCVHEQGQWRLWYSAQEYTLVDTGPFWTLILRCSPGEPKPVCEEEPHYDAPRDAGDQWLDQGSWVVPPAA